MRFREGICFLQSALFLHGFQRTAKGDASVAVGQAALQVHGVGRAHRAVGA